MKLGLCGKRRKLEDDWKPLDKGRVGENRTSIVKHWRVDMKWLIKRDVYLDMTWIMIYGGWV